MRDGPYDIHLPYNDELFFRLTDGLASGHVEARVILDGDGTRKSIYFRASAKSLAMAEKLAPDIGALRPRLVRPLDALLSAANRFQSAADVKAYDPFNASAYFSAQEICSYFNFFGDYHEFAQIETLPHPSWQTRRIPAVHITRFSSTAPKFHCLILGGTHGNEWPGTDVAIALIDRLVKSVATRGDLHAGGAVFPLADLDALLNRCVLTVVPCVNPDGREYSEDRNLGRRGNLREGLLNGVDLNRNYDYLWDDARLNSNPDKQFFKGPAKFSEPETSNILFLMKRTQFKFLIDIHTPAHGILVSWANDLSQSTRPDMCFSNRDYDGMRGGRSSYKEFMPVSTKQELLKHAANIQAGLLNSTNARYAIVEAASLPDNGGEGMGLCQDYAFSRHLVPGATVPPTLSYTIELDSGGYSPDYRVVARRLAPGAVAGILNFLTKA